MRPSNTPRQFSENQGAPTAVPNAPTAMAANKMTVVARTPLLTSRAFAAPAASGASGAPGAPGAPGARRRSDIARNSSGRDTNARASPTPANAHDIVKPLAWGTIDAAAMLVSDHIAAVTARPVHRVRTPAIAAIGKATAAPTSRRRTTAFDAPPSPAPRVVPTERTSNMVIGIEIHAPMPRLIGAHRPYRSPASTESNVRLRLVMRG